MSDDHYMSDPKAKTVAGFVEGILLLSTFMEKGQEQGYFCGAEHDELFIYVDDEKCPESSAEGQRLVALGFHVSDGAWSYFT